MLPNIHPSEPMSQVVFIHDYLQLVFQDDGFSIYNIATLRADGTSIQQGQPSFCDKLVGLIGQTLTRVSTSGEESLVLTFQSGASLMVPSHGPGIRGPEAWQFNSPGGPIVVEQNV